MNKHNKVTSNVRNAVRSSFTCTKPRPAHVFFFPKFCSHSRLLNGRMCTINQSFIYMVKPALGFDTLSEHHQFHSANAFLELQYETTCVEVEAASCFMVHAIVDHFLTCLSCHRLFTRFKNSSLVIALDRIQPNMQLVMVDAEVFSTPLITMHR